MDVTSGVLLELYCSARELPVPAFQERALSLLKSQISFDFGMWGVDEVLPSKSFAIPGIHFTAKPALEFIACDDIQSTHLAEVKARQWIERGIRQSSALDANPAPSGPIARSRSFEGQNLLVAIVFHRTVSGFASLWRRKTQDQFSEQEQFLAEALMPHLLEAGVINLALRPSPGVRTASGDRRARGTRNENEHTVQVHDEPRPATDRLTPAQRAVAFHAANGLSYKQVAKALNLSPATVRNQLHGIYQKLGVSNKGALARWWLSESRA
jgi:DNA-binding CsgD family transcriptional regulator